MVPKSCIQDDFLHMLRENKSDVAVYLSSGIKLKGKVYDFDDYVIMLESEFNLLIYKHAVSSIMPIT